MHVIVRDASPYNIGILQAMAETLEESGEQSKFTEFYSVRIEVDSRWS